MTIDNDEETISVMWVSNDDRVRGTLYYGKARDFMVAMFNSVDKK